MIPFHFGGNYAHHPPLTNFAQIAVAGALGQDEWQIRLGYLNGLATLVLIPVLLRTLRVGWSATLLATGALAVTPMFWMYGRVGGGFALIAGLAALVVYLRRTPAPSGWMIVLGALVTAATVMLSWVAAATALFWVWLVWARRLDRVSIALAGGGSLGPRSPPPGSSAPPIWANSPVTPPLGREVSSPSASSSPARASTPSSCSRCGFWCW